MRRLEYAIGGRIADDFLFRKPDIGEKWPAKPYSLHHTLADNDTI